MKNALLFVGAMTMFAGCGGGSTNPDGGGTGTDSGGMMTQMVSVSGFTVDVDLLLGTYAMNPNITAPQLIMKSCVPNTPVYALYEDGSKSDTVMADAMCNYTVQVKAGSTVHMVAAAAGAVLATYSQDKTVVGTAPVTNVPAHVCTSNPYSAPSGLAKALGIGADILADQGACMFGTNDHFTAPFVKLNPSSIMVTTAGFDVYALTDPTTTPPTLAKMNSSPIGVFGITQSGLKTPTTITIQATASSGSLMYAPFMCDVKPGFITFAPEDPSN